jgi:flagellin
MAFRIRNNYEADVGLTYLNYNRTQISKLQQQLATGLRIVRAADDTADLFIADNLKQTYVGLQRGTLNAQYGLAFTRIADDSIGKIYDIFVKIKDKIVEAANSRTEEEREQIQAQINEYARNIAQIVYQTEFDGFRPLNGDPFIVQYGSHKNQYLVINGNKGTDGKLYINKGDGVALSVSAGKDETSPSNFRFVVPNLGMVADKDGEYEAITDSDFVIQLQQATLTIDVTDLQKIQKSLEETEKFMVSLDKWRGFYGNIENKLQNIIENNQMLVDNMKEAESKVRNVDYASAMAEFNKMRIIMQANISAIVQANQIPQLVQELLR